MSTYFGGRSEVHVRRAICRVLYCDFRSMYPSVSVLMGLWRYVIASGVSWHDATAKTQAMVDQITLADLARPETWRKLAVLVQVVPDADLFPVRAAYQRGRPQFSIGLNYLSADEPLWFTLADVLASKLRTGKTPRIVQALAFAPEGVQGDLRPIDILGNSTYHIDPCTDDFYRRLVELRSASQTGSGHDYRQGREGPPTGRTAGPEDHRQRGLLRGLRRAERDRGREPEDVVFYSHDGQRRSKSMTSIEEPGRFFHPLLATLTTGAARLMLALVECLAVGEGIDWAICDTDSMALACPEGMDEEEFLARAERVRTWFSGLDPYRDGADLFKLEDANYCLQSGDARELEPLYCYAVSAKRYALFNLDAGGRPVLRKASAHGLGHLLAPYGPDEAPAAIPAPVVEETRPRRRPLAARRLVSHHRGGLGGPS